MAFCVWSAEGYVWTVLINADGCSQKEKAMTTHTNGRRITTHEATVKTAAVEIKVLSLSGKQMTLAVFRQLKRERLLEWVSVELRGVPWGLVNYHADCVDRTYHEDFDLRPYEHLHVVWQSGDELRQDVISGMPLGGRDGSAFMNRWSQRYEELSQLDQLFIAV